MNRSDVQDELVGRAGPAVVIGLVVTLARVLAGAAGDVPRPLWFALVDLAVTIPTFGLGLPILAQALQARRARGVARRLGGQGWACDAAGGTFGLANRWVPGVLVATARGTAWHPLHTWPGVGPVPLGRGVRASPQAGPSTWAELDAEGRSGRIALRVRPGALRAVTASLARP